MQPYANVRCPEGQVVSTKTGKCIKDKRKPCAEGKQRNPQTGRCTKRLKPCPPGYVRNPSTNHCVKSTTATTLASKTAAGVIKPAPRPQQPRPMQTGPIGAGAGPSTSQHRVGPGAKPQHASASGKVKQPHHSAKDYEEQPDCSAEERRARLEVFFDVANEIHAALLDARSQARVCAAYEYMVDKYHYPFPKVCKKYVPEGHHLKKALQYRSDETLDHLQEDWEDETEVPVKVPQHLKR